MIVSVRQKDNESPNMMKNPSTKPLIHLDTDQVRTFTIKKKWK